MKLIVRGACPKVGEASILTLRGEIALIFIFTDALAVAEELSVTVRVAEKVPADEYVWEGFWAEEEPPSPKVQL